MLIVKEVERVIGNINVAGVMSVEFDSLDYADKAALFDFEGMEHSSGIKVYRSVLYRPEIRKDFDELFGEFRKLYVVSVGKRGHGNAKWEKQR